MRTHVLTTTAVMALISAPTVSTRAQTTNWAGATNDWFTAGNWTAGVPTLGTSATLSLTGNPTMIGTPGPVAQSLGVGQFALGNLTIQNGGTLITAAGAVIGQFTRGDVTVTGPDSQVKLQIACAMT
jgi:hypothetical protein